jgi:hypothetical protein
MPSLAKGRDGLHPSVKVVDEHLARRVLTGDPDGVLDRVVELRVEVELRSTPTAQPGAVLLFDDAKEVRAHAPKCRPRPAEKLRPQVPSAAPFAPFATTRC